MTRGPAPKRDEERRRRNKDAVPTTKVDLDALIVADVEIPVVDETWEPEAQSLYNSFARSGQSIFYEPSDWAFAYTLCGQLDRWLKPVPVIDGEGNMVIGEDGKPLMRRVPMPGAALTSILKGMASLMALEGDRRRLRIELERKRARDAAAAGEGKVVPITQKRQERFSS